MTGRDRGQPPAFQFYPRDFVMRSSGLTVEARGALILLLCHAWFAPNGGGHSAPNGHDHPCTLPNDDATLSRLSGLGRRWPKYAAELRAQFDQLPNGRLRDRAQYEYWLTLEERHERRSQAGRKGNEARWNGAGEPQLELGAESHGDPNAIALRRQNDRKPIANDRSAVAIASASAIAVRDRSSSGAERVVPRAPANGAARAAPPAPLTDPVEAAAWLPDSAVDLVRTFYGDDSAARSDAVAQLAATLTPDGAKIRRGTFARAVDVAHLDRACRDVLNDPPRNPLRAALIVLQKLADPANRPSSPVPRGSTVTEHQQRTDAAEAEQLRRYRTARHNAIARHMGDADDETRHEYMREARRRTQLVGESLNAGEAMALDMAVDQIVSDAIGFPTFELWTAEDGQ